MLISSPVKGKRPELVIVTQWYSESEVALKLNSRDPSKTNEYRGVVVDLRKSTD